MGKNTGLPPFHPDGHLSWGRFDAVEVHRCVRVTDTGDGSTFVEQDDDYEILESDEENVFYSVFLHIKDEADRAQHGAVVCIADCPTEQIAIDIEAAINHMTHCLKLWSRE